MLFAKVGAISMWSAEGSGHSANRRHIYLGKY